MTMPPFPANVTQAAVDLFCQIANESEEVRRYNAIIATLTADLNKATAARDTHVANLVMLRSGITRELVGYNVP